MSREEYDKFSRAEIRAASGWPNVAQASRDLSAKQTPANDEAPKRRGRPPKIEAEQGEAINDLVEE